VFPFFDGFNEWNGWVQFGGGRVTQAAARVWEGDFALLKTLYSDPNGGYKELGFVLDWPFVLEAEVYRLNYNGGQWDRIGVIDADGNGYEFMLLHDQNAVAIGQRVQYAGGVLASTTLPYNPEYMWYHMEFVWLGDGNIVARVYDANLNLLGETNVVDTRFKAFTRVHVLGGVEYLVDAIRIRPYLPQEPTVSIGPEETVPLSYSNEGNWLGGFLYRDEVTIENRSGEFLRNYQLRVVMDTAALISQGKMRADCGDVRFTDGDGARSFHIG